MMKKDGNIAASRRLREFGRGPSPVFVVPQYAASGGANARASLQKTERK
jgi:hypothetical protein